MGDWERRSGASLPATECFKCSSCRHAFGIGSCLTLITCRYTALPPAPHHPLFVAVQVRECITTSALLRLPMSMSREQ